MNAKNYSFIGGGIVAVILIIIAISAINNSSMDNETVDENNVGLESEKDASSVEVSVEEGQKNYVVEAVDKPDIEG